MAPNKKKKKIGSNPARGFATTSLPSKAKEARAEADAESLTETAAAASASETKSIQNIAGSQPELRKQGSTVTSDPYDTSQMSPEQLEAHLEDAELENIIEAHASRVKAETVRQVARLESERRQLRPQSHRLATASWLTEETVKTVLAKYEVRIEAQLAARSFVSRAKIDETSLLTRLWTLERVLQALKLPDIDTVIEHVLSTFLHGSIESTQDYIWGLQESLKWYAIRGKPEDLPDYENGTIFSLEQALEHVDMNSDAESVSQNATSQLDHDTATDTGSKPEESNEEDSTKDMDPIVSTASEDEDPSTFIDSYIHLQTLLFDTKQRITRGKRTNKLMDRQARIVARIQKLTSDVLFDIDTAQDVWRPRLHDLEIEAAQSAPKHRSTKTDHKDWKSAKKMLSRDADQSDNSDGDLLGDMFAISDSEAQENSIKDASTVKVIDFGKWSGPQPRTLMEEACRSLDTGYKVRVSTMSATAHATRQRLQVRWSSARVISNLAIRAIPGEVDCKASPRRLDLTMQSIAAATPAQAEAFLSTLVLFLISASDTNDQKQSNRLPVAWRSTYQDTNQVFKQLVLAEDKMKLKGLQANIRRAMDELEKKDASVERPSREGTRAIVQSTRSAQQDARLSDDEAIQTWAKKASTSAYQNILPVRQQLPIHQYKEEILHVIEENGLVVVCAETGAGKSTQVPSFILEHEMSNGRDCRILVTQPRRISAITLARRVSQELGESRNDLGTERSLVGYAIRLESKTSRSTRITFATTGVLLRMIEGTPDLEDIKCLVLDEVHERTMDLDLLFIALRKLRERRPSLKIVLMSATVDAQKFSLYFGGAPIMNVPGRTFPVEVRYLEDAIEDTLDFRSASTRTIPAQEDDEDEVASDDVGHSHTSLANLNGYRSKTRTILTQMDEYRIDYDLISNLAKAIATQAKYIKYSTAILIFMPGIGEIRRLQNVLLSNDIFMHDWVIHLLHSSFSTDDLERAFAIPPPGQRKIVIATNIAETGITIPDVTAVIDTCKEKMMRFDERRQLSRLAETFISRSSARQRKGRAARVQDGLCFHLVTRYRYENLMLDQHVPEMLRLSLQEPILRIKIWNLGSIEDTLSAAIDPPTIKNIHRAIQRLKDAGALNSSENLTPLGKQLARLPLEVVLGKMAIFGVVFKCLDAITTIIAILTSKSPFINDRGGRDNNTRLPFSRGESDLITNMNAYQGWRRARIAGSVHQYCRKHHLSDQNLSSIEDQKVQLLVYLVDAGMLRLDLEEKTSLNRSRGSGHRRVLFDVPERYNTLDNDNMLCTVVAMSFYPRVLVREGKGWRNVYSNLHVNLTSNSVNRAVEKPPKWLCYYEAMQTKAGAPNVLETSKIPEAAIIMLMGEADFRYFAGVVAIDSGRIRFDLKHWSQLAVLGIMRECLTEVIQRAWQNPGLPLSASEQMWIEVFADIVAGQSTISKRS